MMNAGGIALTYYDIQALKIEKRLLRNWVKKAVFFTGKGKANVICGVQAERIAIQTSAGKRVHHIQRKRLRDALAFLLAKKTATRLEIERYSHMNSALLGLLKHLLIEAAAIIKNSKGQLRITIKGVRCYFGGLERSSRMDREAIKEAGARYILASYYYLRDSKNPSLLTFVKENNMELLIDSGEYSAYKARQNETKYNREHKKHEIKLEEYAAFINLHKDNIWGYFNLDVTNDPVASKQNYDRLFELTGIKPIPVWHPRLEYW